MMRVGFTPGQALPGHRVPTRASQQLWTPWRTVDTVHRDDTELHLASSLEKNLTANQTRGIRLSSRKAVPTSQVTKKFPCVSCWSSHASQVIWFWKCRGSRLWNCPELGEGGSCLTHVSIPCRWPCKGKFKTDLS